MQTRKERFMGWYHSHPFDVEVHSHCFLSSTDISTQLSWQRAEDPHGNPWLAIVVRCSPLSLYAELLWARGTSTCFDSLRRRSRVDRCQRVHDWLHGCIIWESTPRALLEHASVASSGSLYVVNARFPCVQPCRCCGRSVSTESRFPMIHP